MHISLWAPFPERVELVAGERRWEMDLRERGLWDVEAELGPGDTYAFSLDGGEPLPDPRSNLQPEGVDGPSQIVDHEFAWTDLGWTPDPFESWVIYELHVGTFTQEGTFDGAIERLDHLVDLGVSAVELMPVNHFAGERGWGYDGVDLWAPHTAYGGVDGLKRLVDACHAKGLAVILDVVYNHLGPAGNYLPRFGPFFTDAYKTPWGDAVNFDDAGSDGVRCFVVQNALHWLSHYHFDALRLDAIHAIFDRSATHILEEISEQVEELVERVGRPLYLIAESDLNDPRVVTPRDRFGFGMDAQWSDDLHHALHSVLTGEADGYYSDFGSFEHLAKALRNAYVYDGKFSGSRGRRHGRPHQARGSRFLAYVQNHDQIGNRARGERLSQLVGPESLRAAAALVLLSPFVPMLFMGEEWGASTPFQYFTDHDAQLGRAVAEGRRAEFAAFGWDPADVPDPQDPATFERSKLDWREVDDEEHAELLDWHRKLIALRRAERALAPGDLSEVDVDFDEAARWIVLRRGPITVACNLDDDPATVEAVGEVVLSDNDAVPAGGKVELPPHSTTVLKIPSALHQRPTRSPM